METIYIIGDVDSSCVIPARISTSKDVNEEEKVWASISMENISQATSEINSMLASHKTGNSSYRVSAQQIIERLKCSFDDGSLGDCLFSLSLFDWHVPGTTTVFSRSITHE